jgi:ubiquinone biosynthesis protein
VQGRAGLAEAVAGWERELAGDRTDVDAHATQLARFGPVAPLRTARHWVAIGAAQIDWLARKLPRDLADRLRPLREPVPWVQDSIAFVLRDQLALLGPAGAELARILEDLEGLAPDPMTAELARRPVRTDPLAKMTVDVLVRQAFGEKVARVGRLLSAVPISQLHEAELADGTPAYVRVRRPGTEKRVLQDLRIAASLLVPFEWLLPPVRNAHPLGLVEMGSRRFLEETDLRNEALNAVEIGLIIEELGIEGIDAVRPIPGLVTAGSVVFEGIESAVPLAEGLDRIDRHAAAASLVRLTAEAAIGLGVFHADLGTEQLVATPSGRLGVVGCGTIGRLDLAIRKATMDHLVAVIGGDIDGEVTAMQALGAISEDTDLEELKRDLAAMERPDPMKVMLEGEPALLSAAREALLLQIRHRVRPPVELMLFYRTFLSLRSVMRFIDPDGNPLETLMPFAFKLPELRAQLEAQAS